MGQSRKQQGESIMSYLHTPASKGYTDSSGKFHQATMLIGESNEERLEAYDWLTKLPPVQTQLMTMNRLKGWNQHDDDVIPGIAHNIGPIHRGGRFRDVTQAQWEKFMKALAKLDKAIVAETGKGLTLPSYFVPKNIEDEEPMLSSQLVKRLNDVRRSGEEKQQELMQDPTLINDNYPKFKDVWGWYLKKKKSKQRH